MGIIEKMQATLKIGNWIFDDVFDSYQRQLSKKINIENPRRNISELCLAHYKRLNPSEVILRSATQGLDDLEVNKVTREKIHDILSVENPGSSIGKLDEVASNKLKKSLLLIQSHHNKASNLIAKNISLFLKVNNVDFRSASHPHLFGVILIGDGMDSLNAEQAAISIIHELAHQELFLINLADRLVNKPFDHNEIHAPFQGKKRPPIGRLHSLWALYRMVEFQTATKNVNPKYVNLLSSNIDAFEDGELTEMGKVLVKVAKEKAS